jgi:Zn-dependent protease/CBS domain-containing protein
LFLSLLFHELSHSLVARAYGLPVGGITLFLFGGMAELQADPRRPREEFWMAIAGPIASVVLGSGFYLLSVLMMALGVPAHVAGVALYLGFINFLLAIFNMVPGFPMDGGRVLRAALWHWMGDLRRATHWASLMGQGFGLLLVALGIYSFLGGNFIGGMWWFLIGLFIRGAAIASYRQLLTQLALKGHTVRRFMTSDPVTVPAGTTLREFVDDYLLHHAFDSFPVVQDGRLLGYVTMRQVRNVPEADWGRTPVAEVCRRFGSDFTVDADADAGEALELMQRNETGRLVVTEGGRVAGILVLKDLLRYLQIRAELGQD